MIFLRNESERNLQGRAAVGGFGSQVSVLRRAADEFIGRAAQVAEGGIAGVILLRNLAEGWMSNRSWDSQRVKRISMNSESVGMGPPRRICCRSDFTIG